MHLSHMDSRLMFSSSLCFFYLFALSFCFHSASCAILSNESDRLALLAFKASITDDPLGATSSWNNSIHFCRWNGVTCGRRHQRVTVLDLHSHNLAGSISPFIGNLSFLTKVWLYNNSLSSRIPPEISRLRRLQILVLQNNSLTGEIPANLSSFRNLNRLWLGSNKLGGKIPVELGSLIKLLYFSVYGNNLIGLRFLDIGANNLGGVLPESISNLSRQLQVLAILENPIEGTIPAGIGNLRSLEDLSLTANHLSGSIPKEIGNLRNLKRLNLDRNELTDIIPSSIGNLKYMIDIDLQVNKLQGIIPPTLANCTNLLSLGIADNNISGTIPPQLFNITSLAILLELSYNHLSGGLPQEVQNLKNLAALDISWNRLSGGIPSSLGSCVSLQKLRMENNFFHGTIPSSLSSLRGLDYLDLSHNNLSGQIPSFLKDLTLLNYLNLSFNNFVGMVPKDGVFKNASATSVEGNKELCGGIPEFHLQECKISGSAKNKRLRHSLKIAICIILVFVGVVVITIASLLFWLRKKKEKAASTTPEHSLLQVSYQTLCKATHGFSSANLIGVGSYGSVYKGTLDQNRVVAIKVFHLQRQRAFKSFIAECEAMKNIRHRNLVKVITACSSIDIHANDFKALVYEFMENGSLEEWLHPTFVSGSVSTVVRRKLNLFQRLNIAIDVASALDYLHYQYCQTPIVHCDLKPGNVLLDDEMTALIGDFGLVKFLSEETNNTEVGQASSAGVRGTVGYAAPDYGMGSEVSTHGDVYSYGILILEMFSGKRPTDDMFNDNMNLHNYVKKALPQHVEHITESVLLDRQEGDEADTSGERNQKIIESLVLIFGIGIACSEETPIERMNMRDALAKLLMIRNKLTDNGGRGRRAQVTQSTIY